MRTAVCTLACAALLLVAAPASFGAATLRVSPLIVELDAAAGDEIDQTISASAVGDEPLTVEVLHADFGFTAADYQVTLIADDAPETTAFSTRDWFSPLGKRTVIPAGGTRELPLKITVPENTPGGTYLGAALVRVVPPETDAPGSQVQAVPQAAILYFTSVEGGDPPKASLRRFDLPSFVSGGPIRPSLRIENLGDEFFTFEGTVKLSGPGKDETVDIERQFVVPGEPRDITSSADDKGDDARISLGSRKLGIGRYTVTTRLRIEPTGTTLVERRTVWVIPTWARVAAVLVALLLLGSIALLVRWWVRRDDVVVLEEDPSDGEDDAGWEHDEASFDESEDAFEDVVDSDDEDEQSLR